MRSISKENYLKTIFHLSQTDKGSVSATAIAGLLQTKAWLVTEIQRKLAGKQLVSHQKYRLVTLSTPGRTLALQTIRHLCNTSGKNN